MQTKSGMRVPHKDLSLLILSIPSWSATSMKTWHVPCNSLAGAHQYLYWCVYLYSAMPGACPEGVATPEGRSAQITALLSIVPSLIYPQGWMGETIYTQTILQFTSPLADY